jgi:hypothetical protein
VTKLLASQWERYSASKLLGVRGDAGRVDPYDELSSDKALGESLEEMLPMSGHQLPKL